VTGTLGVIATAGHVDHGKSALIVALTGIDPDRFEEEKRRGLTIDLGYAWTTLPSGREVGFVDVPGHERFIRNMLAGVGPVRLVLFVVGADEGWKPQSEEHLQILDVLGVAGGVIALTKTDLVDAETLEIAADEVRERVAGTALARAPVVPVSARSGDGLPQLIAALDAMVTEAPPPDDARTRLFVDRIFSIAGAGTVVTGTLTGGCLRVDQEVALEPGGVSSRVRSLQTHKLARDETCHVSRVAANLPGIDRAPVRRGTVVCEPRAFRPTTVADALVRPVRDLDRFPERGAFLLHAGSAETSARLRMLERRDDGSMLARIRTDDALVLDVLDRFVLWDAGRRHVVGGGKILDIVPPRAASGEHLSFLERRAGTNDRRTIGDVCVDEARAIRACDLAVQVGIERVSPDGWLLAPAFADAVTQEVVGHVRAAHLADPLAEGASLADVRRAVVAAIRTAGGPKDPALPDVVLERLHASGAIVRTATTVRSPEHRVELAGHGEELERLRAAIDGEHERTPPTVKELVRDGFDRSLIDAAGRAGVIVRISPDLVVTPAVVEAATRLVRDRAADGITVSQLREGLATSRKYAVPLAEYLDAIGVSRRVGDLRFPRDDGATA
jgi:selenocysteine-specific elongation factor